MSEVETPANCEEEELSISMSKFSNYLPALGHNSLQKAYLSFRCRVRVSEVSFVTNFSHFHRISPPWFLLSSASVGKRKSERLQKIHKHDAMKRRRIRLPKLHNSTSTLFEKFGNSRTSAKSFRCQESCHRVCLIRTSSGGKLSAMRAMFVV